MIKKCLLLAIIVAFNVSYSQSTYYVDNVSGDDGNSGTSTGSAWETILKVNSSTFSPGDQILFKSGQTFYGKLIIPSSGTNGNQITFGKYGGSDRPIINGRNYLACIDATGKEYITINDLELTNNSDDDTTLVDADADEKRYGFFANSQSGLRHNIILDNLKIHSIYPSTPDGAGEYNGHGITFTGWGAATNNYFDGITIENCEIFDTGILGIGINKWGSPPADNIHKNVTIRDNYIHHTGGSGTVFFEVNGYLIENNLYTYTGDYSMDLGHTPSRQRGRGSGFWCVRTSNGILQYNEFSHAHGPKDSCGAHIDIGNDNVIIQYNLSYDNAGGFAEFMGDNTNCIYRYNVSINDGWRVKWETGATQGSNPVMYTAKGETNGQPGSAVWFSNFFGCNGCDVGSFNNHVYNNTFYIGKHVEDTWEVDIDAHIEFESLSDNNEVKNNLFYVEGSSSITYYKETGAGAGNVMDYNMYNREAPTDPYFQGANDISPGWPLFANAGGIDPDDYRLAPGSPAIDSGVLMASNGGKDYFGNLLPGNVPTDIGAHETTSCGDTNDFNPGTGWSSGTPTSSDLVTIKSNYTTATNGGSFEACQLIVNSGKTLTISSGDHVKINGSITIRGDLIIEHEGSLVQVFDEAIVKKTNSGSINVELTTPVLQTRDFMVMGSPMSDETRGGVFGTAFLVLDHTPANFIPHPGVPAGGTNFADDNGDFWNQISVGTTPINIGEGYIVRPQSGYTDPANVSFYMTYSQGTLNNGNVNRSVIFNGLGTNPDGTPNVFSNPYASAIDADDIINGNTLVNEIYFWEHLTPPSPAIPGYGSINFSMGDISMYNLSGGTAAANDPGSSTTPNGIISTGQGFGIKAFGAGTVTFTNSMRQTTGNTTLRGPIVGIDRIRLRVANNQYGIGSNTMIAFNQTATQGVDPGYDSNRLATAISLYSHLLDGTRQLGIQTRETFESGIKVPMGFASQVDAETEYTISIVTIEGDHLSNATVYLIDHEMNIITSLNLQDYQFKSDKGVFNERFTVFFEEVSILGNNDTILQQISIFPNPTENIINIISPMAIDKLTIYDVRGREVLRESFTHQATTYQIDMSSLDTAMYFVKIDTQDGSISRRVIKK